MLCFLADYEFVRARAHNPAIFFLGTEILGGTQCYFWLLRGHNKALSSKSRAIKCRLLGCREVRRDDCKILPKL
jgi:hypothetical protein